MQYIQRANGQMNGAIGNGRDTVPTTATHSPSRPAATAPKASSGRLQGLLRKLFARTQEDFLTDVRVVSDPGAVLALLHSHTWLPEDVQSRLAASVGRNEGPATDSYRVLGFVNSRASERGLLKVGQDGDGLWRLFYLRPADKGASPVALPPGPYNPLDVEVRTMQTPSGAVEALVAGSHVISHLA